MEERYLIDTNVIIDFLGQKLPLNGKAFVASIIDESFITSFICKVEVLSYNFETEREENTTKRFLEKARILGINDAVIDQTIFIRQRDRLKLPDALIPAKAIVHDLTLISRNERDFFRVTGLKTVNLYSL